MFFEVSFECVPSSTNSNHYVLTHDLERVNDKTFDNYMTGKRQCLKEKDQSEASLYGVNLSRVEESHGYSSCSGRANFLYISLQKLGEPLTCHEKQKVGST